MFQRGIVFSLLLASALSALAQTPADFGPLRPRATRKLPLASGDRHRFRVAADSGQYFRVAVEKKGIDLVLSIADPKGREVASFNSSNGAYGFEQVSVAAEQSGDYTVEVPSGPAETGAERPIYQTRWARSMMTSARNRRRWISTTRPYPSSAL